MFIFKKNTILLILIPVLIFSSSISAQEIDDKLIFSEVYLEKNKPEKSWVEIYNPTDNTLVLERFRLSHLRTLNVLPLSIKKQGGIIVNPQENIVLCASEIQFSSPDGKKIKTIIVNDLKDFRKGGFFALISKIGDITSVDGFRYGEPYLSANVKKLIDCKVVPFSKYGKSFSRISFTEFVETSNSPGLVNEKK